MINSLAAMIVGLVAIPVLMAAALAQESTSRSVWDGVYTEEQANRGNEIYARECSKCHASDLSGVDEAPALAAGAFLSNWDTLTVGDLSERIRISMPPNSKGKLSRAEIVDVIAYLLTSNGFPAGKTELNPKPEFLKQIKIEATKPKTTSK